jgi:hypothetical protein
MGESITFVVRSEEAEQERQRMQQVLTTGSWRGQYIQQRKDGASFWRPFPMPYVVSTNMEPTWTVLRPKALS